MAASAPTSPTKLRPAVVAPLLSAAPWQLPSWHGLSKQVGQALACITTLHPYAMQRHGWWMTDLQTAAGGANHEQYWPVFVNNSSWSKLQGLVLVLTCWIGAVGGNDVADSDGAKWCPKQRPKIARTHFWLGSKLFAVQWSSWFVHG